MTHTTRLTGKVYSSIGKDGEREGGERERRRERVRG